MSVKVAPSLLSADFLHLEDELASISNADFLHFDVMDGSFVPNISFGLPLLPYVKKCGLPVDVHLMVRNPEEQIPWFIDAGADAITFHMEAQTHAHRALHLIKDAGKIAGVVLNPGTSLSLIEELLPDLDMVLLMSVNPGFGGQKFIPHSLDKISRLKDMAEARGRNDLLIEVDGGISLNNAKEVVDAGANVLVSGSGVFGANPKERASVISRMQAL